MIEVVNTDSARSNKPVITVVGVGGGGNNAVDRMIEAGLDKVRFVSMNTDYQVLEDCQAQNRLQLGKKLTGGYGAGGDPSVGEASAEENAEEIASIVSGSKMVILTCGLGGGTGTGAIPVIARICREQEIVTVAVVTLPFSFEGQPRQEVAQKGLDSLRENVDMLLVIPNDKLLTINGKSFYLEDAFKIADSILKFTIEGITNIIFGKGTINLDFRDLKTILSNRGYGHFGIGTVSKDGPIMDAVKQAINSPLLDTDISSAASILINTSGHINLADLNEAISYIKQIARPNVNIMWGTVSTGDIGDDIVVTIIATGLSDQNCGSEKLERVVAEPPVHPRPYSGTLAGFSSESGSIFAQGDSGPRIPEFLIKYSGRSR